MQQNIVALLVPFSTSLSPNLTSAMLSIKFDAKNPDPERRRAGGGHLGKSGRSGVFIQAAVNSGLQQSDPGHRAKNSNARIRSYADAVVAEAGSTS